MKNLIILCFTNIISAISYSICIPLYPQIAYSRGFDESFVGMIFGLYAVSSISMIPFSNKLISIVGRKNILVLSKLTLLITNILFISLFFIENRNLFIIISFASRLLQGSAIELIVIIVYSYASILNEVSENSTNLSNVEAGSSIGYVLGPLLVFIFSNYGYTFPFMLCTVLEFIIIYSLIFHFYVKEEFEDGVIEKIKSIGSIKKVSINSKRSNITEDNTKLKKLKIANENINDIKSENSIYEFDAHPFYFVGLIFNKKIIFTFIIIFADNICESFYGPVFVKVMQENFKLTTEDSSLILSLIYFVYFFSIVFVRFFINRFSIKFLMCLGLFINAVSLLFLNPIHSLPSLLSISVIGYCLLNAFAGFICICAIYHLKTNLMDLGFSECISSDNSSAIYVFGVNIAELFGPFIGGVLTSVYDFEMACLVIGLFQKK